MSAVLSSTARFSLVADATILAATLDGLDIGVLLLGAGGRLVHANTSGQAMLAEGDVLYDVCGRLASCDLAAHRIMQQIFATDDAPSPGRGSCAIAMTGLHGQRYVAHVLPLPSATRRYAGMGSPPLAAVFVRKATMAPSPRSDVIAKAFNLTPTELRVLLAIVELGSIPETAAALGVAVTTVKTHVRRLFEKTGATRQADFVKLVAAYATPLREVGATP